MKLRSLHLHQFRQHASSSVDFTSGLTGIVGTNGSGKTTLVEAIGFALFGSKALRGRIEDVKTRSSSAVRGKTSSPPSRKKQDNEPKVLLTLEQTGVVYRVERTLTEAAMFVGGEPHPIAVGNREVTARVASIIGMSHEEFIATYCTEQKGLEFLSGKKGATEREKFVVRMMGYDRLEKMQELLREDRKEKRAIVQGFEASVGSREELESRILSERATLDEIRIRHDEATRTVQKSENDLDVHRLRLSKLSEQREKAAKIHSQIASAKLRLEERNRRTSLLDETVARIEEQLAELRRVEALESDIDRQKQALQARCNELAEQLNTSREESKKIEIGWREQISALESEFSQAKRAERDLIGRMRELATLGLGGECPTCGQTFGESFEQVKEHFAAEVERAAAAVRECEARLAERQAPPTQLEALKGSAAEIERDISEARVLLQGIERGLVLNLRLIETRAERESVKSEELAAHAQLEHANELLADTRFSEEEYQGVKGSFEVAQRLLEVARLQRVKLEGEMNMKAALVERTESELQRFDERMGEAEKLKREVRLLDESDRVLTEFRKHVNSSIRPRLSELASEYIADLTDGRYTAIELAEDFTPTVLEDGETKPIISGGEEDILNLCMRLALSHMLAERAGQQFSLLILDEIFGSLDEGRRGNVLSLLEKLRKRFEQIIVITHLDDVKEGVQRLIQVAYDDANGTAVVSAAKDDAALESFALNF